MSNTFIPVDLDQVLDEFEEQEKNLQDTPPLTRPDSLNLPNNFSELKPRSVSDPRTYSFNSPLEAILNEQSKTIDNGTRKSLAQELADLDLGPHMESNDDDDVYDVDDDGVDGSSDASSTTAVIAAAEKIARENNFGLTNLQHNNHGCGDFEDTNGINIHDSLMNASSSDRGTILNEIEDDSDFLSLLNSVVEDKSPFRLETINSANITSDVTTDGISSNDLPKEVKQPSDIKESTGTNTLHNLDNLEPQISSDNNIDNIEENSFMSLKDINTSGADVAMGTQVESANIDHFDVKDDNDHDVAASENEALKAHQLESDLQETLHNRDDISNDLHHDDNTEFLLQPVLNAEVAECNNSNDLHNSNNTRYLSLPVFDAEVAECNNSLLVDINESKNNEADSSTGEDLLLNVDSETEPVLVNLNTPQNLHEQTSNDDISSNTNELVEGGTNSENVSASPEHFHQDGHEVQSVDDSGALLPSIQSQMNRSAVDSSSADSLCGDEAIPTADQGEAGSPARTLSPDSQLSEGIQPVHISSGDPEMGFVPPIWVPDEVATHCMTCGIKFTMLRRKHHCRACGRVLCSSCCNMKYPLPYLGNKDARVCQVCCDILLQGANQRSEDLTQGLAGETLQTEEDTNRSISPEDLVSEFPVDEDDATTMATEQTEDPEQILDESLDDNDDDGHADDDIDNDDNIDEAGPSEVVHPPVLTLPADPALPGNASSASLSSAPLSPALSDDSDLSFRLDVEHVRALIPQDSFTLPPVLTLNKKVFHIQERPDTAEIMYRLKGLGDTVIFLLNKNLIVKVKIVKLKCCVKKKCWCFVTDGMGAANQEEMVVLLECEHSENTVPKDVLSHFNTAFTYAKQGHVVSDLGFTIFGQPFLGSSNNAGFLYIKPTFQCLDNLPLPTIPYIVGILIQRQEAPWAQLFPIRLMLRLGTEFRYYPCPLWSVRNRESVYREIGHTIMNLLTDFKNFQYSIPRITGLVIHMEDVKTTIRLPQDRFDEVVKVLNSAEEHMFAFGANFSSEADSHLVCIQEGESYKTQAINIQNKTRKVTGASFVVFSGSLKTSNPNDAKVSIIEDGLMIQMLPDSVLELRKALREMQDYVITIGSNATQNSVTHVNVEWVSRDTNKQPYISPIDGRSLTDVPSIQVHSSCDFSKRDIYRIRWTNVFLERSGSSSRGLSSRGLTRLTGELARACCEALRPYLQGLFDMGLTQLSLRVNVDAESVEYSIGSNQEPLPTNLMADLDSALIPSINAAALKYRRGPLTVELFFSIISLF